MKIENYTKRLSELSIAERSRLDKRIVFGTGLNELSRVFGVKFVDLKEYVESKHEIVQGRRNKQRELKNV